MRAGRVLQELLASCWASLDQRLVRRVLGAIEAMVDARQVVLMELARQYPGATHTAAPLKALDRLLSNPRVQAPRVRHQLALFGLERSGASIESSTYGADSRFSVVAHGSV